MEGKERIPKKQNRERKKVGEGTKSEQDEGKRRVVSSGKGRLNTAEKMRKEEGEDCPEVG